MLRPRSTRAWTVGLAVVAATVLILAPSGLAAGAPRTSAVVVQDGVRTPLRFISGCFVSPSSGLCVDGVDHPGPTLPIAPDRPFTIELSDAVATAEVRAPDPLPARLTDEHTLLVTPGASLAGRRLELFLRPVEGGDRFFVGSFPAAEPGSTRVTLEARGSRQRIRRGLRLRVRSARGGRVRVRATVGCGRARIRLHGSFRVRAGRARAVTLGTSAAQRRRLRRVVPVSGAPVRVIATGLGPRVGLTLRLFR